MKKIGILTLCGNDNYGNKLQNYAIIEFLKSQSFDAETIWVTNPFKANAIKQYLKYLKQKYNDKVTSPNRRKYFLEFNKLLNIHGNIIFNNDMKHLYNKYDYFFVGSDQVWNCTYFDNDTIYFLDKSPKNKNIAFSASFGVSEIPDNYVERYKKGLNNFSYISVREDAGKEIVEKLTGRNDAEVLVDPTMLLTSTKWDEIARKPKELDNIKEDKYILNYFLGDLSENRKKEIERIAKENNCHIINLLDKNDPFYNSGPREFLYLEKHAFLICTDSFHSSVFAIQYDRPFIIFDREQKDVSSMNSRIDTLINKFKLENRKYNEKEITKENLNHNYNEAYLILEKEREKCTNFIKNALNIK